MVFPLISQASFDTNFKYGSRDERIKEIQEFLTDQGLYSGPITGNYYSLTRKAVIAFQARENISPAYGFWGSLTRAKANSIKDLDDQNENSQELSETGTISNGDNDVCANIEGIQTTVPSGMLTDSLKNCAVPVQNVVTQTEVTPSLKRIDSSASNLSILMNGWTTIDNWVEVYDDNGVNTDKYAVSVTTSTGTYPLTKDGSYLHWKYHYVFSPTKTGTESLVFNVSGLNISKTLSINVNPFIDTPTVISFYNAGNSTFSRSSGTTPWIGNVYISDYDEPVILKDIKYTINSSDYIISDLPIMISPNGMDFMVSDNGSITDNNGPFFNWYVAGGNSILWGDGSFVKFSLNSGFKPITKNGSFSITITEATIQGKDSNVSKTFSNLNYTSGIITITD